MSIIFKSREGNTVVRKFNAYHDEKGKFSSANSAASFTIASNKYGMGNALSNARKKETERTKAEEAKDRPAYFKETEKAVQLKINVEDYDLESTRSRMVYVPKSQLGEDGRPGQWITEQKAQEFYSTKRGKSNYDATWEDANGKSFSAGHTAKEAEYATKRQQGAKNAEDRYNKLIADARAAGAKVRVGMKAATIERKMKEAQEAKPVTKAVEWRKIKGTGGQYEVSNTGKIRSLKNSGWEQK